MTPANIIFSPSIKRNYGAPTNLCWRLNPRFFASENQLIQINSEFFPKLVG